MDLSVKNIPAEAVTQLKNLYPITEFHGRLVEGKIWTSSERNLREIIKTLDGLKVEYTPLTRRAKNILAEKTNG